MGITVSWDNEAKTIIRYCFEGRWDWNDFYTARAEAHTMLDEVSYKVGIIVDVQLSNFLPNGAISHIRGLPYKTHPNTGRTILVGANTLIQALYNLFQKLYSTNNGNFMLIRTLEEARAMLSTH
jgi:hypothetical protein